MILGLTGGIATGKSLISDYFRSKGCPVIDADQVSRQIVEVGSTGLSQVADHFGSHMLLENGELDRKKLGRLIFSDAEKRKKLNAILHPLIRAEIFSQLDQLKQEGHDLIVLDLPLLFESSYEDHVDQVMVVHIDEDLQIERLMKRDDLSREEALQRIHAQMPLKEKMKRAHVLIDNSRSKEETYRQLETWLAENI